jgi:hypothetical protein
VLTCKNRIKIKDPLERRVLSFSGHDSGVCYIIISNKAERKQAGKRSHEKSKA